MDQSAATGMDRSVLARVRSRLAAGPRVRGDFARNVLKLSAANAIAQGLSFAAYPILTRIYRPDQLGILSAVLFAMMLLTPLSTLRYEIALPICVDRREAGSVLTLSLWTVAATSALMAFALGVLPAPALSALGPVAPYRLFVPLALLVFGCFNVLVYEASRVGAYGDISRTRVSQALVGPVAQIGLGLAGLGTAGLLVGFVTGLSSGTWRLGRRLLLARPSLLAGVTPADLRRVAHKFRHFALYSSWAGVLAGSANLGNILFTTLYGATVGGYVFLGDRVMLQPLRVSGNAFLQVFVGEGGRVLKTAPVEFAPLLVGALWKQALLSGGWLGAVYLSARFAMPLVFGDSWGPAADYVAVMLIGFFPTAVAIPASHALLLMGQQRLSAALDALRFAVLAVSIGLSLRDGATPLQAVFAYSIAQGAVQTLILAVIGLQVARFAKRSGPRTDIADG